MATTLDPYATLGVPAWASHADVARAHRRLAKQFHPDVNPGSEAAAQMRQINAAWRLLSDPARRARYDATVASSVAPAFGYAAHAGAATWAPWPDDRRPSAPRARRPARPEPLEPSFGDRPALIVGIWIGLGFLFFIGSWLGSLAP